MSHQTIAELTLDWVFIFPTFPLNVLFVERARERERKKKNRKRKCRETIRHCNVRKRPRVWVHLNAAVGHATCTIPCMYLYTRDFIPAIRLKQNEIKGETKRRVRFPREFHNTFLNRSTGIALHARFIMPCCACGHKQRVYLAAFQE